MGLRNFLRKRFALKSQEQEGPTGKTYVGEFFTPEQIREEFGENSRLYLTGAELGQAGAEGFVKTLDGKYYVVMEYDKVIPPNEQDKGATK